MPAAPPNGMATSLRSATLRTFSSVRQHPFLTLARLALLWVVCSFCLSWFQSNKTTFFNPDRQHDDVFLHVTPFHRYANPPLLFHDAVTEQNRESSTPLFFAFYRTLAPLVPLPVATKIVQGFTYLILFAAVALLLFHPRGSLAAACLLLYLALHSSWIAGRTNGGLQRGFGMPVLLLWIAAAACGSPRIRGGSVCLAALTYPAAFLLAIVAEGFVVAAEMWRDRAARWWLPATRLLVVTAISATTIFGFKLWLQPINRLPTLAEAQADPSFHDGGRSKVLPLEPAWPWQSALSKFWEPLRPEPKTTSPLPLRQKWYNSVYPQPLSVLACLLLAAYALRWMPLPWPAVGLASASLLCHAAATYTAFKLHIPERLLDYGLCATGIAALAGGIGYLGQKMSDTHRRDTLRALVAVGFIASVFILSGDGIRGKKAMNTNYAKTAAFYDFIKTLPLDSRLAGHPKDVSGIPFWCGRAVVCSFETDLCWLWPLWQDAKDRTRDTFSALYATDLATLVAYAEHRSVTHLVVTRAKYADDWREVGAYIQPFRDENLARWASLSLNDLLLSHPPEQAVIYSDDTYLIIDLAKWLHKR